MGQMIGNDEGRLRCTRLNQQVARRKCGE
jgi:hypothetical protein